MDKEQKEILAKCKYYKVGKKCPYNIVKDHAKYMFWNGEASAVNCQCDVIMQMFKDDNMGKYCDNIDTNIAAAIWGYYCHLSGRDLIADAKKEFIEEIKTY